MHCLSPCFGVELPNTARVSMGFTLLGFFWWGSCAQTNNLWSTPPIQKSTIEQPLTESPSMLKVSDTWQKWDGTSKVCLHYTSHKTVYKHDIRWRQMHRPTHASKMPGGLISADSAKLWYHHGSWFCVACVPHLNRSGWSWLPWDMLSVVSDVAIPDGTELAGSLSTGGLGAGILLCSTPATGMSSPAYSKLGLMGSK